MQTSEGNFAAGAEQPGVPADAQFYGLADPDRGAGLREAEPLVS